MGGVLAFLIGALFGALAGAILTLIFMMGGDL